MSASITSRSLSLAAPIACISSSSSSSPRRSTASPIAFLPILAGTRSAIWSNSLRPIAATSAYSLARTARRIEARALPVTTNASHDSCGSALAPLAPLMISTTSPLLSGVLSGMCRPLILAPTVCAPRSVCTAKAKSTGVAPLGSWNSAPFGVNAKIRSW